MSIEVPGERGGGRLTRHASPGALTRPPTIPAGAAARCLGAAPDVGGVVGAVSRVRGAAAAAACGCGDADPRGALRCAGAV